MTWLQHIMREMMKKVRELMGYWLGVNKIYIVDLTLVYIVDCQYVKKADIE